MGKVKSAIITTLLVIAIVVLTVFSTVSFNFSGGVSRYNSILSSISLGSDLTGEASAVLYPEGVISSEEYESGTVNKDEYIKYGSLYVLKSEYNNMGNSTLRHLENDAKIIAGRFDDRGLVGYSVSVLDDFALKITVDSGLSYSAYVQDNTTNRSTVLSKISQTVTALTLDGKLSLRCSDTTIGNDYDPYETETNSLVARTVDVNDLFKRAKVYGVAQVYAVEMKVTDEGSDAIYEASNTVVSASAEQNADSSGAVSSAKGTILFYVGNHQLLTLTTEQAFSGDFYISVNNADTAKDYATILDSVISGNEVLNEFTLENNEIKFVTSSYGEHVAVALAIAIGVIIAAAIAAFIVAYKKLGIVNALMIACYALAMICAIQIINITVTTVGAICAIFGLVLLCGSNVYVFQDVKNETKKGKTMQASVKSGYKNTVFAILDLHVIALLTAIALAIFGVGELASCGLILIVATIASYVLYWFTRFMWYVMSDLVKDKFAFCGFKREVYEDE